MSAEAIKAGRTVVEIGGDDSALRSVLRSVKGYVAGIGKQIRQVGSELISLGVGIGVAGLALLSPFTAAIEAASNAEETLNKFNAVFGEQAAAADAFAVNLATSIGRGVTEVRDGMAAFQAQFVGLGFSADEARAMAEQMTALSYDFGSFFNISDSEAAGRFISAMSGSGEVLDRFGVNIKASALDAEFLRMGLDATTASATEQQKALARFNIIRNTMQSQGAIGDALKTADSFANSWKRVKSQVTDSLAAIGEAILPTVAKITSTVAWVIEGFAGWVRENKQLVVIIASVGAVLTIVGGALTLIGGVVSLVGTAFGGLSVVMGLVSTIGSFLFVPMLALVGIVASLVVPVLILWGVLELLGMSFGDLFDTIGSFWDSLIEGVDWLDVLTYALIGVGAVLAALAVSAAVTLSPLLISLAPIIAGLALVAGATWLIIEYWDELKSIGKAAFDGLIDGVTTFYTVLNTVLIAIYSWVLGLIPGLKESLGEIWEDLSEGARVAFASLRGVLSEAVSTIYAMIGDLTSAFGGIGDSFAVGDWAGAFEIGWLAVQLIFQRGKNYILSQWADLKFGALTIWDQFVAVLAPTLRPVLTGIIGMFFDFVAALEGLINTMIRSLPEAVRDAVGISEINISGGRQAAINSIANAFVPGPARVRDAVDLTEQNRLQAELDRRNAGAANARAEQDAYDQMLRDAAEQEQWFRQFAGQRSAASASPMMAAAGESFASFSSQALSQIGGLSAADRTAVAAETLVSELIPGVRRVGDILDADEGGVRMG